MKMIKDIPEKFLNMVRPVEKPEIGKPDFEFIVPSGQFWGDLTVKEQEELRQIVAAEGQNLDNYLYEMRKMLPRTPSGKG